MPALSTIIGQASRGADLYFVFRFLRLLTMKYEKTDAYKLGIIDKKGKPLKRSSDLETVKEKSSYTMLHRLVWKIRGLIEKVPLLGKSILLNYAAALFLLKEQNNTRVWTDENYMKRKLMEFLETDWESDAKLLKEEMDNMNRKTFGTFLTETKLEESQELQAMMALDDAGIEAVINRKGQIVINKKDLKNAQKALKKSFRKGGAPELKTEEVEIDEKTYFNIKKFGPVKPVTSRSMYLFARKLYDWANENAGANKKELKAIAKKIEKENKLPDFKEMPEIVQSMMTQEFGIKEGIDIKKASMGDVIKDFKTSDAPQFKGKSDKKKKEMAIAAKLSREENEDDDPVGKSKKKSKKDVINLKPTAESSMKKLKDIMIKMKEKRSNNVDEAVNLKKLKKEYDRNEDKNHHTENYLLLAKAFGTPAEVKKVQEIMKRNEKQGSTSKADSDWMYKNINKYYDKIRNEEVEVEESDGYEVDLAAKKIQHKWKRMSKAEKVRFLDKMDVLAGKTKVSDSDLEDILSDYGLTMEATGDKEAYEKFFQSALKKFGVKSPAELKGDKKKEFFNYVDKNWTGDHEEQTNKEQTMTKKSLKDAVSGMKEKKSKVTEAMTIGGLEVGEQEFDKGARIDHVAPNLGMTYKDYQAKFETNGLEGPYQIDGGAYFWDKTVGKWFSVETEDYVDDKTNAELNFRYTKGGSAGGGLLYKRSYNN